MKICAAQLSSSPGGVTENIEKHIRFAHAAADDNCKLVFFPELSLTGYQLLMAEGLATDLSDAQFDAIQHTADARNIIVAAGMPTISADGVRISMLIFSPYQPRSIYSKQQLHFDEFPYFVNGPSQSIIEFDGTKIVPAICYESMQPNHAEHAKLIGADLYLVSVAKSDDGMRRGNLYYPEAARINAIPLVLSNATGPCEIYACAGGSAAWNSHGVMLAQLGRQEEGLVIFDSKTQAAYTRIISETAVYENGN